MRMRTTFGFFARASGCATAAGNAEAMKKTPRRRWPKNRGSISPRSSHVRVRTSRRLSIVVGPGSVYVRVRSTQSERSARSPAGQRGRLFHPFRHLRFVELIVLVDIDVAHLLVLAGAGRDRSQRRT